MEFPAPHALALAITESFFSTVVDGLSFLKIRAGLLLPFWNDLETDISRHNPSLAGNSTHTIHSNFYIYPVNTISSKVSFFLILYRVQFFFSFSFEHLSHTSEIKTTQ